MNEQRMRSNPALIHKILATFYRFSGDAPDGVVVDGSVDAGCVDSVVIGLVVVAGAAVVVVAVDGMIVVAIVVVVASVEAGGEPSKTLSSENYDFFPSNLTWTKNVGLPQDDHENHDKQHNSESNQNGRQLGILATHFALESL